MANMSFGVNILPKTNNTYTLGNSNYQWNIFVNQINGRDVIDLALPVVTSTNNGQILKVENGAWTVGTAPTSLPSVSSTDNGKILKVSNGAWAVSTADTPSVMTGCTSSAAGSSGLVTAPSAGDENKFLAGDGTWKAGGLPMVILSYGSSTWADFEAAYNNNVIVYCRASSNSNPATGSQTRMAFMAYVNNATTPTNVEFQYYRSVNAHSATQMGDQVFIYKLDKTSGWSVTTREASIKEINVASGSKLGVNWSSNKVTLSNTMTANDMPMSSSDATTAKAAIDTLNSNLANLVKTVLVTWEDTSIASGEYKEFSKDLTNIDPTGYTFVALTLRTTGSRHMFFVDYEIRNVSNVRTLFVHVKNTHTSSVDGAPIVRLHYVKTGCATE